MQQVNIALDLYSALLCLILLVYLRSCRDRLGLYFMLMCGCNLGMALSDITNWACEGFAQPWYPVVLWAGSLIYYLCSGPLLLAFTGYTAEYVAPKVKVWSGFFYLAGGLCAVQAVCSLLSLWNGMYFTVTADNLYQRGSWFWLSQLIPALIYVIDITMMLRYRRFLQQKDFITLCSYIFIPLLAEIVQMLNYGIALLNTGATLSILLIFVGIQSERELRLERQEKELAEYRIDIMLSQIQPHFLYNALTTIRRLCGRNPKEAQAAITDFARFLRANMDSLKSKAPIPFVQELAHVEHYLSLEQRRFQNRLSVVYDITARDFSIPPLTLQPIVENAVRHGVLKRESGGTVTIRTLETKSSYLAIVEDDGVGLHGGPADADEMESHTHIGTQNVRERLNALCGGTLTLDSTPGMGTTATITIPKEGTP